MVGKDDVMIYKWHGISIISVCNFKTFQKKQQKTTTNPDSVVSEDSFLLSSWVDFLLPPRGDFLLPPRGDFLTSPWGEEGDSKLGDGEGEGGGLR